MKVLFAIGKEQTSKRVAEKYYEKFGEELDYKNVFYFKALLEEVKDNKTYDRIVISEELEEFVVKNVEALDRFIFNNIDNITDEIENSEIIVICSDRRSKNQDKFVERLFSIGVYNILIGNERNVDSLCNYIKNPLNKKEAKRHLNINPVVTSSDLSTRDDEVEEIQILNILKYYDSIKGKVSEYVPAFDRIAEQYSQNQLKVIASQLPPSVKRELAKSEKYIFLSEFLMTDDNRFEASSNKQVINKPAKKGLFGILMDNKKKSNGLKVQNAKQEEREQKILEKQQLEIERQREKNAELRKNNEQAIKENQAELDAIARQEAKDREQAMLRAKAEQEAMEREQAEYRAKAEQEARERQQAELQAKAEQEAREREQAELRAKAEQEAREREQTELRAKAEQEAREREQAELRAKAEQEVREREQAELRAKAEQEAREREQAELRAKAEQEAREREQAELQAKAVQETMERQQVELQAKAEQEAREREQAELRAKAEQEAREREQAELRAKAEQEARERQQAELRAKAEQEARERQQAELRAKAEQEARERQQAELRAKAEQEAKERQQAELRAKAEQEARERQQAELQAKANHEVKKSMEQDILEEERRRLEQERRALEEERKRLREQTEQLSKTNDVPVNPVRPEQNVDKVYANRNIDLKKMVVFVGANKSGTTFLVNAIADNLVKNKVSVGILDMTKDKSLYYIYNQDDKDLRNIAAECMQKLSEGVDSYIPVGKFLKIYTSIPGPSTDTRRTYRNKAIIDTVRNANNLVIVDADFSTALEYYEKADEIYIVQDLDIMKMQEATLFLRELKNRSTDMNKVRIIINKYVKSLLTPKKLLQGLSYYNDPQMSFIDEILSSKVPYYLVPFNVDNYAKYIDSMYKNSLDFSKYSQDFLTAINDIATNVYRRGKSSNSKKKGIFG